MNKEKLKKIYITVFITYLVATVLFAFLAGDQLKYRESRSNIDYIDAEAITNDIVENVVVEQSFYNLIDRLESISFVCTTHFRKNSGTLTVDLIDDSQVIYTKDFDVSEIEEQRSNYIYFEEPFYNLKGHNLIIRFTSDSKEDEGVALMMTRATPTKESFKNGEYYTIGRICFRAEGSEEIFTGKYYWHIMTIIGLALGALLFNSYNNYSKNKKDYLVAAINAVIKYEFLISQLVTRDFKSKYKRSVFGVLWSFLNPLLTMTVQFLVFSTIFKTDTKSYPVYLLSGVVCYSFFNEATTMCLSSISGNSRLINKVYIPKYIFPLSRTISSSINLGISLIPLTLVTLIMGLGLKGSFILMFFFIICLIIFALGVGLLLSTLMVFFRDIQFLWSVICMIWMYATPIFYPTSIIPPKYSLIVRLNPLQHFIKNIRICLIDGISPEPINYVICFVFAIASLLIGAYVFKKNQDKFTLYL